MDRSLGKLHSILHVRIVHCSGCVHRVTLETSGVVCGQKTLDD